jgi:hypothetical protein
VKESRGFREVVRTVTVSYPISFQIAALLTFTLGCFGGALVASDALRWLFAGVGASTPFAAIGFAGYAMLRKPDLLRS